MSEWNNSKLYALQKCGEYFRRRYLENDQVPRTRRMARGSAVHAVMGEVHKRQMEQKATFVTATSDPQLKRAVLLNALPSAEETADMAADAFEAQADEGLTYTEAETRDTPELILRGQTKDTVVALSGLYVEEVAPKIDPIYVERRITVKPQDSDLVVHGTVDLGHHDPLRGEIVRDLKTAERSPNKKAADESQQLTMYSMLRGAETGQLPQGVALDYVVQTKAGGLKYVELQATRDARDVRALVHRLNTAVAAAEAGVFVPAQPGTAWWCSPGWCEYWSTCKYVNAKGAADDGE